jgi:catechol 2,3-dioxygenase-like lactoylglutathione lyase family enzyme
MAEDTLHDCGTPLTPALGLTFYSHATLECKDIAFTRRFFRDFLGFETVQMSTSAFWARLGGEHVIVVVQGGGKGPAMPFLNHNGLDVPTDMQVDQAHAAVVREADRWGLKKVTKPKVIHGSYCFYFWDADDNAWEILSNPNGGYSWAFSRGDQVGAGHMSKTFDRPQSTQKTIPPSS